MLNHEEIQEQLQAIGQRLAEARNTLGLDQQELSRRAGVSRVMISDFERSTRTMSVEHLLRLANGAGIQVQWLLQGTGEMVADGPSRGDILDQARKARKDDYDFIAAVNAMLRRYERDKKRMTWGVGACINAYWGAYQHGFADLREVAQVLEVVCDRFGLDLIEVLESTTHSNASQYIADWLLHRGIDPEAFGPAMKGDEFAYEVRYHQSLARPNSVLQEAAKEKGLIRPQSPGSKVLNTLNFLLGSLRVFGADKRE